MSEPERILLEISAASSRMHYRDLRIAIGFCPFDNSVGVVIDQYWAKLRLKLVQMTSVLAIASDALDQT